MSAHWRDWRAALLATLAPAIADAAGDYVMVERALLRRVARLLREAEAPGDTPRDFRWSDAPAPDPITGFAPLAPSAADLARALAERDEARVERDGLARRLQAVGAISRGARFRLDPEPGDLSP